MVKPYFIVGIIGNVISVLLCACPVGTFWDVAKNKSAENHNAIPYIFQLLCKTLWTFYGVLDPNGFLIITVNSVGVLSQLIYIFIYIIYAPDDKKVKSLVLVGLLNIGIPGSVIAATLFALDGNARETFIGAFCAAVTVAMYGAPFSVIVTVVQTKSVEYMPFFLSFFLLLNAGAWFTFGVLLRDYYVIVPNAVGLVSGSAQILIYLSYKRLSHENTIEKMVEEGKNESAKVPTSNPYSEGKMRYRSSSLPVPVQSIDRQYSLKNLTRAPSAYILVP